MIFFRSSKAASWFSEGLSALAPARTHLLPALLALLLALLPQSGRAQEQIWIQIEARSTFPEASERARAYAQVFPETRGFVLPSGWHAIVLGPYGVLEGERALVALRRENMIPADSYITDGREFRTAFWPPGGALPEAVATTEILPEALPEPESGAATAAAPPEPEPAPAPEPEETLAEARASEAALSPEEKRLLQTALQWFGHYAGGIDGAFGPGTRNAMTLWQESLGLAPTGVLTARQRATLVANYQHEFAEYGFAAIEERESGIDVTLPLALVEFDRYEPPFVHYREKDGSGLSIMLISQPGDAASFSGLYDILQSLEAIPASGERRLAEREFSITGQSASHDSRARAFFQNGVIKGWIVLSAPEHAQRNRRAVEVLEQSFRPVGSTALDPGLVPLSDAVRRGLVAGLEVKRPKSGRSGFYIGDQGLVLTTTAAVESCARITLDRQVEAGIAFADAALGIAVLRPEKALAPPVVAGFATDLPPVGAEISVAGYSYAERLPSAVQTFGTFEEAAGLEGEPGLARLSLSALPGDAGGPVMNAAGGVIGMLLPEGADAGRVLPPGVAFAATAATLTHALGAAGIGTGGAETTGALPPETLTRAAAGMTVLVSCWE
ncbi:serine protease [Pseudogemmobacter sonorensis]|uniref:serine protease n=1 Tax=Pseudogemmobacter sonorensis TaxID=2989681 RepID=UPI0036CCBA35